MVVVRVIVMEVLAMMGAMVLGSALSKEVGAGGCCYFFVHGCNRSLRVDVL